MKEAELKAGLLALLREQGAALCGVGDLRGCVDDALTTGISVALPVPAGIVRDLRTAPTLEYNAAYHDLNARLNALVQAGAAYLTAHGYRAAAVTTDTVTVDDDHRSALPHKTAAVRAGLGWIGKSNLLVTKEYGASVRLSTLRTDAPMPVDGPLTEHGCGDCRRCVELCPAGALTGTVWQPGMDRDRLLDAHRCFRTQLDRMEAATGLRTDLCGLCFAACPYTLSRLRREGIE